MQMFTDLPLSLQAAIGGALILILLLVLVRQRKAEAGSGSAREKKARAPKAERTPKSAKAKKAKAEKPAKTKRSKDTPSKAKAPKEKAKRDGRRFGRRRDDAPAEPAEVPAPVAATPSVPAPAAPVAAAPPAMLAPQPGWPTPREMVTDPLTAPASTAPEGTVAPAADPAWTDPVQPVAEQAWVDSGMGVQDAPPAAAWPATDEAVAESAAGDASADMTWATDDTQTWATPDQGATDAPAEDPLWEDPEGAQDASGAGWIADAYQAPAQDQAWADPALPQPDATTDGAWTDQGQAGDPTWAQPVGEADAAGFDPATGWAVDPSATQDAPADDWTSQGDWESSEEPLPEAPQPAASWDGTWETPGSDTVPVAGEEVPVDDMAVWDAPADEFVVSEEPAPVAPESADDLDWSALGTIDADIPATPWTEEEIPVDEATSEWAIDDAVAATNGEPVGDALWAPVEEPAPGEGGVEEIAGDDGAAPATSWHTDPVWPDTPATVSGSADDASAAVNGARVVGSVDDIASAVRPLDGDDAAIVIDLARILENNAPVELVIEQSEEGILLRVGRRQDAPLTADDVHVPAAPEPDPNDPFLSGLPVDEDAATPVVDAPIDVSDDDSASAGDVAVPATVAATPSTVDDPRTGSGDQDPSRILADIRARLAALDARRGTDGSDA